MPKYLDYSFLEPATKMPPLKHQPYDEFDIMASEVADYLVKIPSVRQKLFDMANSKGFIVYDPVTKTWKGAKR